MKALFYIILFTAISSLIWQIVKLIGLTKNDQIVTKKENNINGWLMLATMIFLYVLMVYYMFFGGRDVLLPRQAGSEEGAHIDNLFMMTMGLILVVQFITQFLVYYFTFKYRGNIDRKAAFFADSHKLELFWTLTPTVVLSGLIIYGLWTWNLVQDITNKKDNPIYIELYSKQFQWEARYAGKDNVLGEANVRNIKGINTMGVDMNDPNSKDDITVLQEFHIPKGRKVVFQIRSQDVMHSAYMPHFRAQMNCVPGLKTYMGFTPSVTTAEMRQNPDIINKVEGINKIRKEKSKELVAKGEDPLEPYEFDYLLLCNKICGSSHYNMQMKIVVDEPADFNKWLAKQKTLSEKLN
jgi:cytochrome c oxidase subunit 2